VAGAQSRCSVPEVTRVAKFAAIAGIGQTEFSKNSGRSEQQLAAEASKAALDDAGIDPADVDGMITFTLDPSDEIGLCRCLGVKDLAYTTRIPGGGAASVATVYQAMAAVTSGIAQVVLIWRAMNERSAYRFGQPLAPASGGVVNVAGHGTGSLLWCMPFGAQTPASWEALASQHYMETVGVTNQDLGHVSVAQRKHAATNPLAWFYRKPITLEEHQQSRWIVEPVLRLLDCCQESDGGVALVITSLERARDLKQPPVRIVSAAQSIPAEVEVISNYYHGDLTVMPEARGVARRLYGRSGLTPKDMQLAMIYDAFTPQVLKQLEAFGFCGRGEAKDFVKRGNIELGGSLPVNTNGGLIGEAYIHGMNNITEAVRQLRGTATNQVKNLTHALVSCGMAGAILANA
jgi:acetyl-CoA acetyltransferase